MALLDTLALSERNHKPEAMDQLRVMSIVYVVELALDEESLVASAYELMGKFSGREGMAAKF